MILFRDSLVIDEDFMKIRRYITAACAVLLATATLLCGCAKANKIQMTNDGKYVDKNSGITYNEAPFCYEPIAVGEKAYGRLGEINFYEIEGVSPEKWLTSNGVVFYADGESVPSLSDMNISYATVDIDVNLNFSITDAEVLDALVNAYVNGEAVSRPSPALPASNYLINWMVKLADENLGIYYSLSYFELSDGRKLLFNRFENRCVEVGNEMQSYVSEYGNLVATEQGAE